MGRIIKLPADIHREIQSLLPWYRTGGLDEAEAARVEAHVSQCAGCRAELGDEDRLATQIAQLSVDADIPDVEHGWARISAKLGPVSRPLAPPATWTERLFSAIQKAAGRRREVPWLGWAVAAQFCLILVMGAALWRPAPPARYHALAAPPVSTAANMVVIFRPETPEKDLRALLRASAARIVDGPTVADAYLLHVDPAARPGALVWMRRQAEVVLVEPVDGG